MMQSLVKFRNKKKGFTLVELIVVIAIIGILAAILMPRFMGFTKDARQKAVISEAKNIRTLADSYYAAYGAWPIIDVGSDNTFKVQTGGKTAGTANYDNSPSFSGTIKTTGGSAIADGGTITDGAFLYEKDGLKAEFDADGTITTPS